MKLEQFRILASDFLPWMAGIQVRSLVLLALTGVAVFCLRRSSAAMRHLALSLAVLSLLALPLLSLSLPSWSVLSLPQTMVVLPQGITPMQQEASVAVKTTSSVPGTPAAIPTSTLAPSPEYPKAGTTVANGAFVPGLIRLSPGVPSAAILVLLIWGLGTSALLLRIGIGLLRLRRMVAKTEPATTVAPILARELPALSLSLGLRQSVRLVIGKAEMAGLSPMTWGLWNPVVLLPAESNEWSSARLRPVLLHELAHVQRGDWSTELLANVVCALYWPNPLVWLLIRHLRSESEYACDDRVLLAGVAPADYARQLVEVAHALKVQRQQTLIPSTAIMMASRSGVGGRVRAILSGHHSRIPVNVRIVALALVGATGLLLPLANLRIASAGEPKKSGNNTPLRIGKMTFYNGALPATRLLLRMNPKRKMTIDEQRTLAATRFAPGSDRFPNGIVAEGLYVSGIRPDGSSASWDRAGNLLAQGPNWTGSGLKAEELRFQIDRLKLPGTDEWVDKATFDRLNNTWAIESEFGIVGSPAGYLRQPGRTEYGNGYSNFITSYMGKPSPKATKVDLYLTTGYGPWQTMGESRKNQAGVQVAVTGGGTASLSPLVTRRGGVEAEVAAIIPGRFLSKDPNGRALWHLRLEPVDAAGRPVGNPRIAQHIQTGDGVTQVRFRFLTSELPFEKVASVRLLARPLHTIYFRNVPTKPTSIPGGATKSR